MPSGRDDQPEPPPQRREKPPAHESKIFQPSSFASRKAAADAANAARSTERLVSLGECEYTRRDRHGNVNILSAELFVDYDRPMRRFVKLEGHLQLFAMQDEDRATDTVTELAPLKNGRLSRPANAFGVPSLPTPPPRPV